MKNQNQDPLRLSGEEIALQRELQRRGTEVVNVSFDGSTGKRYFFIRENGIPNVYPLADGVSEGPGRGTSVRKL